MTRWYFVSGRDDSGSYFELESADKPEWLLDLRDRHFGQTQRKMVVKDFKAVLEKAAGRGLDDKSLRFKIKSAVALRAKRREEESKRRQRDIKQKLQSAARHIETQKKSKPKSIEKTQTPKKSTSSAKPHETRQRAPDVGISTQSVEREIGEIQQNLEKAMDSSPASEVPGNESEDAVEDSYSDPLLSGDTSLFCLKSLSVEYIMAQLERAQKAVDYEDKYNSLFQESDTIAQKKDCLLGQFLSIIKVRKRDLESKLPLIGNPTPSKVDTLSEKTPSRSPRASIDDFAFVVVLNSDRTVLTGSGGSVEYHKLPESISSADPNTLVSFVDSSSGRNGFWQIHQNYDGSYTLQNLSTKSKLNVFDISPGKCLPI